MVILGLHFGHDAAIAVIKDGEPLLCVERERLNGVKHAITLTAEEIVKCLADVKLTLADVDYVAVTTTQEVEYLFDDPSKLSLSYTPHPGHNLPCTMTDQLGVTPEKVHERLIGDTLRKLVEGAFTCHDQLLPNWKDFLSKGQILGDLQHFIDLEVWQKIQTSQAMAKTDYSPLFRQDSLRHGFHYPVTVQILGKHFPGYVVAHHIAHVAYTFYQSPYETAAILSTDGAGAYGYLGGFFAYGNKNKIYPMTPNHLNLGPIYDMSAVRLGFGLAAGAGKLMGLSAYGKPRFFDSRFVGNWYDVPADCRTDGDWIAHCEKTAKELGYDLAPLGNTAKILEPICVDFAASTQKLIEESLLYSAETLRRALQTSGVQTKQLCMSGGVALNCPSNTRLIQESAYENVFVPPAVMDSGLTLGSSLWLFHNIMDKPRETPAKESPTLAYLGLHSSASEEAIQLAIDKYRGRAKTERLREPAAQAAKDIDADRVIGWFQGRSEIGPRALGHRSILANPRIKKNWNRVNIIKCREAWRPFAPAVLEGEETKYFGQTTFPTYFMLINAQVQTSEIPAITHVDGSARVQSVSPECGLFYDVIKEFHQLSGIPVVLNTSFNGPGQPIVETPEQAADFFMQSPLDVLYLGSYRMEKV